MHNHLAEVLEKLTILDAENTTKEILERYREKVYGIIHFLYFASIILTGLDNDENTSKKEEYKKSILSSDFLLPDGIALKLLYQKYLKKELPNLNGTDFLPYFLSHIPYNQKVEIFLYGAIEEVAQKSAVYITETFGFPVISVQNGFREFNWSAMPQKEEEVLRIFLVGRGSPLQELWVENNREKIETMQCLVFTVGGLLDFWAGEEKRAPFWMRNIKIEWLYRALSNPKKNLKKTLVSLQLLKFLIKK